MPDIREDEAHALIDELVEISRELGYKRAPSRSKTNGGAKTPAHDGGGGGDCDWTHLIKNILEGRELHDSIRTLAAKKIATGANSGSVVNELRGLMDASTAPKDERWHARVSNIPAAVDSAVAKYGKQNNARSSFEPPAEPTSETPQLPTTESPRLRATHNVFCKWLDKDYDIDILDAVLANSDLSLGDIRFCDPPTPGFYDQALGSR